MNLTQNFPLHEFTDSDTATRLGINNQPPRLLLGELTRTAMMLERIRETLGNVPVRISSGYRCEALERALRYNDYKARCARKGLPVNEQTWREYFERKDHPKGHAADIIAPDFGSPTEIARLLAPLVNTLEIGQIILEGFKRSDGTLSQWVHVSTEKPAKPINRVITSTDAGTVAGIVGLA